MARSRTSGRTRVRRSTSTRSRSSNKFIQKAIKNPGALRKSLGVKGKRPIPVKKLQTAARSKNPTMRRRANLALTLRKIGRSKSKSGRKRSEGG